MARSTIDTAPPGMKWIDGGEFAMGSNEFYAEERPVHRVAVDGFWMDEQAVTAADFRRFVRDTGYVTVAERALDPDDYPDADPELLVPGSLVFRKTRGPVNLGDFRNWWSYDPRDEEAVAVWRKRADRRRALEAVELQVLPGELTLPGVRPAVSPPGARRLPRRRRLRRARREPRIPTELPREAPCRPRSRTSPRPHRRPGRLDGDRGR